MSVCIGRIGAEFAVRLYRPFSGLFCRPDFKDCTGKLFGYVVLIHLYKFHLRLMLVLNRKAILVIGAKLDHQLIRRGVLSSEGDILCEAVSLCGIERPCRGNLRVRIFEEESRQHVFDFRADYAVLIHRNGDECIGTDQRKRQLVLGV